MARHHRKHHDKCDKKRCGYNTSTSTYESSSDLTYLCDDKSHHRHRTYSSSSDDSSSSTSSSYESSSSSSSSDDCRGCSRKCSNCVSCVSCGCRECSDYSRSSVLRSLGSASDNCDFSGINKDRKKKCHSSKDSHSDSHSHSHSHKKGKKFVVTFETKSGSHWEDYNTGDHSIWVNGKNTPILHLYRGNTYFFCVEQHTGNTGTDYSLILTDSPVGGTGANIIPGGFPPLMNGCATLKVDHHTPRYFFYQTDTQQFMGGLVIVHDSK